MICGICLFYWYFYFINDWLIATIFTVHYFLSVHLILDLLFCPSAGRNILPLQDEWLSFANSVPGQVQCSYKVSVVNSIIEIPVSWEREREFMFSVMDHMHLSHYKLALVYYHYPVFSLGFSSAGEGQFLTGIFFFFFLAI